MSCNSALASTVLLLVSAMGISCTSNRAVDHGKESTPNAAFELREMEHGNFRLNVQDDVIDLPDAPRFVFVPVSKNADEFAISVMTESMRLALRREPKPMPGLLLGGVAYSSPTPEMRAALQERFDLDANAVSAAFRAASLRIESMTPRDVASRCFTASQQRMLEATDCTVAAEESLLLSKRRQIQSLLSNNATWHDPELVIATWHSLTIYCYPTGIKKVDPDSEELERLH